MFGYTEAQVSHFGLTFLMGGLLVFLVFILANVINHIKPGIGGKIALYSMLSFGASAFFTLLALNHWGIA
ncbi:MAG: DUF2788 domain-containing protein [Rhodocyclaceae bacterium]|nr:MAG: DUF2788 domain-containing protein [Rhodocyclaceae bacterium]